MNEETSCAITTRKLAKACIFSFIFDAMETHAPTKALPRRHRA